MISLTSLVYAILYLVVAGLIFWLLRYLIAQIPMEPPIKQIANVVLTVFIVLAAIGILLQFVGGRQIFVL